MSGLRLVPIHGISTGTKSATFESACPGPAYPLRPNGQGPKENAALAIVSATAFAPFMCVKAFKTSWVRFANSRSDCSRSRIVTAGCDVRTTTERLSFAVLSDDEMMSRWTCISCACATSASDSI